MFLVVVLGVPIGMQSHIDCFLPPIDHKFGLSTFSLSISDRIAISEAEVCTVIPVRRPAWPIGMGPNT